MSAEIAVELANVAVTLGDRCVLRDMSLRVAEGERVALVGANGVGKSTLLDVVLGLRAVDAGTVTVHGAPPPASDVGFVPQDPGASLLPWYTVRENIVLPLRVRSASEPARERALQEVCQRFDPNASLDLDARPDNLSGGQRQLTAFLRALVARPRLLLCDEPFSALDTDARARVRETLRQGQHHAGRADHAPRHPRRRRHARPRKPRRRALGRARRDHPLDRVGVHRDPVDVRARIGGSMSARNIPPWLVSLVVSVAIWAALTETGWIEHRAIAGPVATVGSLLDGFVDGALFADVLATALRVAAGVALGLLAGLPLGLWIGTSSIRRAALEPPMDFLRAIPPLLVFPLLLLAFGYDERARVGVIAFAAALVVAVYVAAGIRRARPERLRMLQAMGASRWQTLRWLHLYEVLPGCLTAARHAVSTGLVVAVVTEMIVGAPAGLGSRAVSAQIAYDAPGLYAVILLTGALGYIAGHALILVERRTVFWAG